MNEYNEYVNAVNKIFEHLSTMKENWKEQDNLNYISNIEEYKKIVADKASLFKQQTQQSVQPAKLEENK